MDMDGLMKKVGDTLNAARDVVLDLTDKAGKKAGEVYDVAKLKIKLTDIRRDISSLYKEVGQSAYNALQAQEDIAAAISEKCVEIERLYREMEEIAKEVEEKEDESAAEAAEEAAADEAAEEPVVEAEIVEDEPEA
ncbi:MAG: hypothetical protein J1F63_04975 [Oscillospiraceae bacterium]|nr:hypothetical protein [Oscillospiraceae bacterium]